MEIVKKSGVERRESHGRRTVAEQTSLSHTLIADPRLLDDFPVDENNPKEKIDHGTRVQNLAHSRYPESRSTWAL